MQQIQSGVNPSRVVVSEGQRVLDEAFISGLTWAVVLEFADRHDCVIYRDGDTLRVIVIGLAPCNWGNA